MSEPNPAQCEPIRREFTSHMLNEAGKERAGRIARMFHNLLSELEMPSVCGVANDQRDAHAAWGREMAIVRTKLEEASFFAKKAMASQPRNQEPPGILPSAVGQVPPAALHRVRALHQSLANVLISFGATDAIKAELDELASWSLIEAQQRP